MENLSQVELESRILQLERAQEEALHQLEGASKEAVQAEVDYKEAYWRRLLELKRTYAQADPRRPVAVIEAEAELGVVDRLRARRSAEATRDVLSEALRTYRSGLSALQTLAANQRALVSS